MEDYSISEYAEILKTDADVVTYNIMWALALTPEEKENDTPDYLKTFKKRLNANGFTIEFDNHFLHLLYFLHPEQRKVSFTASIGKTKELERLGTNVPYLGFSITRITHQTEILGFDDGMTPVYDDKLPSSD